MSSPRLAPVPRQAFSRSRAARERTGSARGATPQRSDHALAALASDASRRVATRGVMFFHAYPHQYAGAQRVVHLLCRELRRRGLPAWVTTPDRGAFTERLAAEGFDVRPVRAPRLWRRYGRALEGPAGLLAALALPLYWLRCAVAIRAWRPAVVHCNDHRGFLLCGPAARLVGVPVVWHLHGSYESAALTRFCARLASAIVVVSAATASEMPVLKRYAAKVIVLHNGIEQLAVDRANADRWLATTPARSSARVVLTGARINPDKGLDVLLRAAARVVNRHPDVDFLVAGHVQRGYERHYDELLALRASLGLEQRFHFLGAVDDSAAAWAAACVYCQPSRVEPFGLGVLEAMSAAKPVVISTVGGLAEIVPSEQFGVRVPPGDPLALADGLCALLSDPDRGRRLGEAGRERMQQTFTLTRMADELLALYADVGASRA